MDDAGIANLIDTNLTATLQLTRSMLPLLKTAEQSCVVNVGSTFGSIGYPGFTSCRRRSRQGPMPASRPRRKASRTRIPKAPPC